MPLRMMEYAGKLYSGYLSKHKLNKYGSTLLALPVPKLVVFYNGERDIEDETILRLTDSFSEDVRGESDIEVRVRMLNINYGRNKELLDACKPLSEYAWFVQEIRRNRKSNEIEKAVDMAIDAMPGNYSIREFLLLHRAEVYGLLDTEYNEDEIRELFMEDGRREERKNTEAEREKAEAERKRADAEQQRADAAEAENVKLREEIARLKEMRVQS